MTRNDESEMKIKAKERARERNVHLFSSPLQNKVNVSRCVTVAFSSRFQFKLKEKPPFKKPMVTCLHEHHLLLFFGLLICARISERRLLGQEL
jgi:hypothetical protein